MSAAESAGDLLRRIRESGPEGEKLFKAIMGRFYGGTPVRMKSADPLQKFRNVAEAASPGKRTTASYPAKDIFLAREDGMRRTLFRAGGPWERWGNGRVELEEPVSIDQRHADAVFASTFDRETILSLLDRIETAEAKLDFTYRVLQGEPDDSLAVDFAGTNLSGTPEVDIAYLVKKDAARVPRLLRTLEEIRKRCVGWKADNADVNGRFATILALIKEEVREP